MPEVIGIDHIFVYVATFFQDPDGVRLEVTDYRQKRCQRHDGWHQLGQHQPGGGE